MHVKLPLESQVQFFRYLLERLLLLLGVDRLEESRSDKSGRHGEDCDLEDTYRACYKFSYCRCGRDICESARILDVLVECPYHGLPTVRIVFRLLLVLNEEQKE